MSRTGKKTGMQENDTWNMQATLFSGITFKSEGKVYFLELDMLITHALDKESR